MRRLLVLGLVFGLATPISSAQPETVAIDADAEATETVLEAPAKPPSTSTPAKKKSKKKKKSTSRRAKAPDFDVTQTAAWRYGEMSETECEAELKSRNISYKSEPTTGVLGGLRLTGPIRGVTFRTRQSEEKRATSLWEIADCRLALALDDFAAILVAHDIVEVRHYSMYRKSGGKPGSQHRGGLAIDAAIFTKTDGTTMDVLDDWHGRIGAQTCGPDAAPRKKTDKSLALRALLCEVAAKRIFNVILTPNHNRGHRNHFHLDVSPGVKWFIVD